MGFWDGSGISRSIHRQSAPCSRQITTPAPHQSTFTSRMLFLTPSQQCRSYTHTHTHTRLTALFAETTRVSRYQKGKTNLDFTGARDSEWQWHQLGRIQVCTSLQTDNHASKNDVFYRPDALPAVQPTASMH